MNSLCEPNSRVWLMGHSVVRPLIQECDLELWELRERLHRWNVEAEHPMGVCAKGERVSMHRLSKHSSTNLLAYLSGPILR